MAEIFGKRSCLHCDGPLQVIRAERLNGDPSCHDWKNRKYHKACLVKMARGFNLPHAQDWHLQNLERDMLVFAEWQEMARAAKKFKRLDADKARELLSLPVEKNRYLYSKAKEIRDIVRDGVIAELVSERRAIKEFETDHCVLLSQYIREKLSQQPHLAPDPQTREAFECLQEQRRRQWKTEVDIANQDNEAVGLRIWHERKGFASSISKQCRLGGRRDAWIEKTDKGLICRLHKKGPITCYHRGTLTKKGGTVYFRECSLQFT